MPTEISTPTAFTASNTTVTLTVVGVVIDVTVIVVITTTTNNLSELAMKRLKALPLWAQISGARTCER